MRHDIARSDLSRVFLFHAVSGEVRSVQDVHAPFYHSDNGNADSGGESKKQNKLDDHFIGSLMLRSRTRQRDPIFNLKKQD
jgi:hypothetical protein